jgi:hypothetical protein
MLAASKARAVRQLLWRGLSTAVKKAAPSVTKAEIPPQLQVMAGYMEYLDTALAKTDKLNSSMEDLKKTYAKKRELKQTIKWTDPSEIDKLFIQAEEQKEDIVAEIAELRALLKSAKKVFAVDAPDGFSDAAFNEELLEINRIINDAAEHEDKAAVEKRHEMEAELRKKVFAVDAPDGVTDAAVKEELLEITHIIDDAAEHESRQAVDKKHKMENTMRKDRTRTQQTEQDW